MSLGFHHTLVQISFFAVGALILLGGPACIVLFVPAWQRRLRLRPVPIIISAGIAIVVCAAGVLLSTTTFESRVRAMVRDLAAGAGPGARVIVDGAPHDRPVEVLQALAAIDTARMFQHKGPPLERFPLVVHSDARTVHLELARDAENEREYWVFLPRWSHTRLNDVGRIRTDTLDAVQPSSGE